MKTFVLTAVTLLAPLTTFAGGYCTRADLNQGCYQTWYRTAPPTPVCYCPAQPRGNTCEEQFYYGCTDAGGPADECRAMAKQHCR
jgi:hypothetical protein